MAAGKLAGLDKGPGFAIIKTEKDCETATGGQSAFHCPFPLRDQKIRHDAPAARPQFRLPFY